MVRLAAARRSRGHHAKNLLPQKLNGIIDGKCQQERIHLVRLLGRQSLDDRTRFASGEINEETVNKIVDLLGRVRDGASPCLNNGTPGVPSWAQRRQFRRIALNMEARLVVNGREHNLLVADVSQGGMRIVTAQPIKIGAIVIVRLRTGRRFVSVVAWHSGQSVGVQFNRELPPDDPLLAAG